MITFSFKILLNFFNLYINMCTLSCLLRSLLLTITPPIIHKYIKLIGHSCQLGNTKQDKHFTCIGKKTKDERGGCRGDGSLALHVM